jgi:4-oxalocrotonate tautomerase
MFFFLMVIVLPVVQVSVWSGMSIESKRKIVKGITQAFEEVGIPREAVEIIIYETPKTNWASGGELHSDSEKLAKIRVP